MKHAWLFGFLLLASCSGQPPRAPGDRPVLEEGRARDLAELALDCLGQERPGEAKDRHPAFSGCHDWPSSVSSQWALLRIAASHPELSVSRKIREELARRLSAGNLKSELSYLRRNASFGEPYGWAWLLRFAQELHDSRLADASGWGTAMLPLEKRVAARFLGYVNRVKVANRVGLHENTAYAFLHGLDYASAVNDDKLQKAIQRKARALYRRDRGCPIGREPGAHDLISPCLAEAELMRRVMPPEEFLPWFQRFLPGLAEGQLKPVPPKNPKDARQLRLYGLMYQRASAMHGIATELPVSDPRREILFHAAEEHARSAWEEELEGAPWLAGFAVYYHTGVGY